MNASEDLSEPLGEAPEVSAPRIEPRAFAAIAEVRALHIIDKGIHSKVCIACFEIHPCPTIQAFDKWGV